MLVFVLSTNSERAVVTIGPNMLQKVRQRGNNNEQRHLPDWDFPPKNGSSAWLPGLLCIDTNKPYPVRSETQKLTIKSGGGGGGGINIKHCLLKNNTNLPLMSSLSVHHVNPLFLQEQFYFIIFFTVSSLDARFTQNFDLSRYYRIKLSVTLLNHRLVYYFTTVNETLPNLIGCILQCCLKFLSHMHCNSGFQN